MDGGWPPHRSSHGSAPSNPATHWSWQQQGAPAYRAFQGTAQQHVAPQSQSYPNPWAGDCTAWAWSANDWAGISHGWNGYTWPAAAPNYPGQWSPDQRHIPGVQGQWQPDQRHIPGATVACSADEEREMSLLALILQAVEEGRLEHAKSTFLQMRELWHEAQARYKERGLTFGRFNSRYQQAFRAIRQAAESAAPAKLSELPRREYVPVQGGASHGSEAKLRNGGDSTHGSKAGTFPGNIRVMTFNILSEYLNDLFAYQFVALPTNSGDFFRWQLREPLIVDEICRWNPTVVCLQEVDMALTDAFQHKLCERGLKSTSVYRRNESSRDGLCFAYDPQVVTLASGPEEAPVEVSSQPELGGPRGNNVISAMFEVTAANHPALGQRFGVLTTHVAGKEPACTAEVMQALVDRSSNLPGIAKIIAGDLNGCVSEALVVAERAGYESAYRCAGGAAMAAGGPIVTAHNDEFHWSGELDHILFSKASLVLRGVVQIQHEERLVPTRLATHPKESLPRPGWPSDHVSLVADFTFVDFTANVSGTDSAP